MNRWAIMDGIACVCYMYDNVRYMNKEYVRLNYEIKDVTHELCEYD